MHKTAKKILYRSQLKDKDLKVTPPVDFLEHVFFVSYVAYSWILIHLLVSWILLHFLVSFEEKGPLNRLQNFVKYIKVWITTGVAQYW